MKDKKFQLTEFFHKNNILIISDGSLKVIIQMSRVNFQVCFLFLSLNELVPVTKFIKIKTSKLVSLTNKQLIIKVRPCLFLEECM